MYNKIHKHHSQVSSTCDVSRKPWVHYCSTDWLVSDFTLLSSVPPGEWKESIHTSNQTTLTSFYILSNSSFTNYPTIPHYTVSLLTASLNKKLIQRNKYI